MLGLCYLKGNGVEDSSEEKAAEWFRKAAEKGNADAMFCLGHCYADGYGVEKDNNEAVKWFRKAAEKGNTEAMLQLGECYFFGRGVEKNREEVEKWFRKADNGNDNALYRFYRETAELQIRGIADALQQYKFDVGTYPSDLQCLMENLDQSEKWDGPYIKPNVPLDPWEHEYQYLYPGKHYEFDLYSFCADGQEGGEDENADLIYREF